MNLKLIFALTSFSFLVTACDEPKYVENSPEATSNEKASPVDTDGDGLTDVQEVEIGTNPEIPDTDGGGVNDGDEVENQTNPVDFPEDDMQSEIIQLTLPNMEFEFDQVTLTSESQIELSVLVAKVKSVPKILSVTITGHTDSNGTDTYNQGLSVQRAEAIADTLIEEVPLDETIVPIEIIGKGESEPIATNDTADGRQKNRRVVVEIVQELTE